MCCQCVLTFLNCMGREAKVSVLKDQRKLCWGSPGQVRHYPTEWLQSIAREPKELKLVVQKTGYAKLDLYVSVSFRESMSGCCPGPDLI